ncbi:histidine kinase, partial [uncultured Fibrobacter sp.]
RHMKSSLPEEKNLSRLDFETMNAQVATLKKLPVWLPIKKIPSPIYLRIITVLFLLSIGYVAAMAGIDPRQHEHSGKVLISLVAVTNYIAIFFLNQFLFVPRLFLKKRFKLFGLLNFICLIESYLLQELSIHWISGTNSTFFEFITKPNSLWTTATFLLTFCVLTIIICIFNVLMQLGTIHTKNAYLKHVQENFYIQADLAFLKQQLSAHFLFNTMNNITALVDIDPKQAQKSMIRLSSILRQMLHKNKGMSVDLDKEIDLLEKYCELEKLRFGPNMQCIIETKIQEQDKQIAPLLLLPLIENAFKYGYHPSSPSRIEIHISENNDILHCHVENTITPQTASTRIKSGIGLANLKQRLEICYPGKYRYETENADGIYKADLQIELKGFKNFQEEIPVDTKNASA